VRVCQSHKSSSGEVDLPRVWHHEAADVDAAKVILKRDLDGLGIYLDAVPRVPRKQDKSTPEEPVASQGKSSALVGEPGNPKRVPAIRVI